MTVGRDVDVLKDRRLTDGRGLARHRIDERELRRGVILEEVLVVRRLQMSSNVRIGPGRPELSCVFCSVGTSGSAGAGPRDGGTSWTRSVRLSGIHVSGLPSTELICTPLTL